MTNLHVLVVEDEPLLLLDLQDLLKDMGVTAVTACGAIDDAVRAATGTRFDVAILDVMVGTDNAHALAQTLLQKGTRVGFVSGTDGDQLPAALRRQPLLAKPYTPEEFKVFFGSFNLQP